MKKLKATNYDRWLPELFERAKCSSCRRDWWGMFVHDDEEERLAKEEKREPVGSFLCLLCLSTAFETDGKR